MILDAPTRKEWLRDKSKSSQYRQINDVLHDRIHIFYPINLILDTSEFQRLRHIQQLGFSHLVFPSANHTRFNHSLGVYALANSFVKELAESQPEFKITTRDQLCICIAALIHDIGHGPFSHFYEHYLNDTTFGNKFCHEIQSKLLFRRMLETNRRLREALEEFLDARDFLFIEELIDPPTPFILNGVWQLKGRPAEKSFLYEIVSNKHSGLDVDKFDYFLRDSMLCNVPIPFSKMTVGRIRDTMKILEDTTLGFRRLMFAEKHIGEISDAFEARVMLHDKVYQHKTVIAAEIVMIDLLRMADKHVRIRGDGGRHFTLSTMWEDASAFLATDDRFLYMLKSSTGAELATARERLLQIERRELPRFVCTIPLDNFEVQETTVDAVKRGILDETNVESADDVQVMVHIGRIHRGMGVKTRPIEQIRVYSERHNVREPIVISKTWFKYNTLPTGGKAVARVYAPFGTDETSRARLNAAAVAFERRLSLEAESEDNSSPKRMKMENN